MAIPYVRAPNYDKNERRVRGRGAPCAICGKPIRDPAHALQIALGRGGLFILTREEYDAEFLRNDCLGSYPIGPDCAADPKLAPCLFGSLL